jgi:hypothetical protein
VIEEQDRAYLIGHGLSRDGITALGELIIDARDLKAQYATPAEVRATIIKVQSAASRFRAALNDCSTWAEGRIEAAAFASPPHGPGLQAFSISKIKRDLGYLETALAAAERSRTISTSNKGTADVARSISRQIVDAMANLGFKLSSRTVGAALEVVLRTVGIHVTDPRQFLKSEKSKQK